MSHFVVMVVTANGTDAEVEHQLAPFHEFECTGQDDEFVKNVDQLAQAREAYEVRTIHRYKAPNGTLHYPYDDEFYRDPTPEEAKQIGPVGGTGFSGGVSFTSKDWMDGRGYRAKVRFLPVGWQEVEVPMKQVKNFAEFIEYEYGRAVVNGDDKPDLKEQHKYGWARIKDGTVTELIDRTNPDSKWDGWGTGGRWSDYFIPKVGTTASKVQGRKRDIDWTAMREAAEREAGSLWDRMRAVVGPHLATYQTWETVREQHKDNIDAARKAYHAQAAVKAKNEASDRDLRWEEIDDFMPARSAYVRAASLRRITPFAFLRDRKWAEKGKMGWWACVSDEKSDWLEQFATLLRDVPDDHFLTIVDCHI